MRFFILSTFLGMSIVYYLFFAIETNNPKTKFNILLLDVQNLSYQDLQNDIEQQTTPTLHKLMKRSYVFENAFLSSSPNGENGFNHFQNEQLRSAGYFPEGPQWTTNEVYMNQWDIENLPSNITFFLSKIFRVKKARIVSEKYIEQLRNFPFLLELSFSTLVPPLIYKEKIPGLKNLSTETIDLLNYYKSHLSEYLDKLTFFWVMFDQFQFYKFPKVYEAIDLEVKKLLNLKLIDYYLQQKAFEEFATSDSVISAWKKSKNISADLKAIKEVYSMKTKLLDDWIREILNKVDTLGLSKHTILILYSSYSNIRFSNAHELESYSKSDLLLDKNLRVPLVIYVPGQQTGVKIKQQISIGNLHSFIKELMFSRKQKEDILTIARNTLKESKILSKVNNSDYYSLREYNKKVFYHKSSQTFTFTKIKGLKEAPSDSNVEFKKLMQEIVELAN